MAIKIETQYSNSEPADSDYPFGSIKNATAPGNLDGTPVDKAWMNDFLGFFQKILTDAGITPSETPDTVQVSQYMQGLLSLTGSKTNLLINSKFNINVREVSGSVVLSAGEYGHDRMKGGSGGCTYTFAKSLGVTTITISAGTLVQEVVGDNIIGGDYVLSWEGTAQAQIDGGGYGDSGDVIETLTGGTNAVCEWGTGTVTKIQLEPGVNASGFLNRPESLEKTMCQAYTYALIEEGAISSSQVTSGVWIGILDLPVCMRATPTIESSTTIRHNRLGTSDPNVAVTLNAQSSCSIVALDFSDGAAGANSGVLEIQTGQSLILSAEI